MTEQKAFECGCVILWDKEVKKSYFTLTNPRIVYCPLHAAAPLLIDIAHRLANLKYPDGGRGFPSEEDITAAHAAIAAAEGKEGRHE
ncbi:MAG: hypothetical protein V1791_04555 [Pseudomonadota bacterium]